MKNSVGELSGDSNLFSDLKSTGISVDIVTYVNVVVDDDDVAACQGDTTEALIEEMHWPSEAEAEAIEEEDRNAEATCDAADAALNELLQFLEQCKDSEKFVRNIGQMSDLVTTQYLSRQEQDWLVQFSCRSSKSTQ